MVVHTNKKIRYGLQKQTAQHAAKYKLNIFDKRTGTYVIVNTKILKYSNYMYQGSHMYFRTNNIQLTTKCFTHVTDVNKLSLKKLTNIAEAIYTLIITK